MSKILITLAIAYLLFTIAVMVCCREPITGVSPITEACTLTCWVGERDGEPFLTGCGSCYGVATDTCYTAAWTGFVDGHMVTYSQTKCPGDSTPWFWEDE